MATGPATACAGVWSAAGLQIGLMTQLAVVAVGLGPPWRSPSSPSP